MALSRRDRPRNAGEFATRSRPACRGGSRPASHSTVGDRGTRAGSLAPIGLRPPARFARTITTPERDLTGRTILALRWPRRGKRPYGSTTRTVSQGGLVEPVHPTSDSPWTRMRSRRDVLKLGAVIAAGGAVAPLLAACAAPSGSAAASVAPSSGGSPAPSAAPTTQALSGPITVLAEGGDPSTEPALKKVYDDFKAQHPGVEWDIRAIPGLGPEWDRLARAALESGEPVGLVMLDGLFVRAWARDGLLADLGADPGWPTCSRECRAFPSRRSGRGHHTSLPPRPEPRRPDHGPVLQQGVARSGGSRGSEDDR